MRADLEHARSERQRAEERLQYDEEHTIIPLREIRQENHIDPLIRALIQRKVDRET